MKTNNIINNNYSMSRVVLALIIAVLFSISEPTQCLAQSPGKSEATIALSYYKNADMRRTAIAVVKAKNKDGKFVGAKNVWVNFYVLQNKELHLLTNTITNNNGQAKIELTKDLPLDDSLSFTIAAKIENDSLYENAEEQMHYKDASLTLKLDPHDTTRTVIAKVTQLGIGGNQVPVKDAEVKFYVQRMFGTMPAAEDFAVNTDEKGEASFVYPKNIAGDTLGAFTVVAKMVDNEKFGNVENKAATSWGIPLAIIRDPFPRELWSPYAPLPLVITISTLFGGVWCVYFYLFYQMRKIKKETKKTAIT